MSWYLAAVRKYAVFSGRARRMEYWMFSLVNLVIGFALVIAQFSMSGVGRTSTMTLLFGLYWIAMFLPSLGVTVRRLHDTGRSGWWLLIALVPLLGSIALLVFMVQEGTSGSNDYGPNPKAAGAAAFA